MTDQHSPRPPPNGTRQQPKQTTSSSDTMDTIDQIGGLVDRFLGAIYPIFYRRSPTPMLKRLEGARMICVHQDHIPDETLTAEVLEKLWGEAAVFADKLRLSVSELVMILPNHSTKLIGISHPVLRKVVVVNGKYKDTLMNEVRRYNSDLYNDIEVPALVTLFLLLLGVCGGFWWIDLPCVYPYIILLGLIMAGCQIIHSMRHNIVDFSDIRKLKEEKVDVTLTEDGVKVDESSAVYTEDLREFTTETRKTIEVRKRTVTTEHAQDADHESD